MTTTPQETAADPIGNNLDSVTPVSPPIEAAPRLSDVLRGGLVTGITAGALCWLLYGIASLFGTDFDVHYYPGGDLAHIPWFVVPVLPLLGAVAFAWLATALRRRPHCRRTTATVGYSLGAVFLLPVLLQQSDVTWPTKIWLTLFTLLTVVLVVPQVARIVGDSDPAVTAGHRRLGLDAA